jgi:hypothetical protein
LQTQNFASGSAIRRSAASCGSAMPHRQHGGGLGLHRQVGDDVLHQRLVHEQ